MSFSSEVVSKVDVVDSFHKVSVPVKQKKIVKPKMPPFSLRLSEEERTHLNEQAGNQPLGAYIRSELLGDKAIKRRVLRKPQVNDQKLALVLSALGESRLSQNLNQLAKHANMGTLEISEPIEHELLDACKAITSMREVLLSALGQRI